MTLAEFAHGVANWLIIFGVNIAAAIVLWIFISVVRVLYKEAKGGE